MHLYLQENPDDVGLVAITVELGDFVATAIEHIANVNAIKDTMIAIYVSLIIYLDINILILIYNQYIIYSAI